MFARFERPHRGATFPPMQTHAHSQRVGARVAVLALAFCLGMLCLMTGCNSTSASSENTSTNQQQSQGTSFVLGNLNVTIYDQEIVYNTDQKKCLAIYAHVTNNGTTSESVMGSYNVSRNQGADTHLKVAVAYDTNGNALHTGNERIGPGESADIALCFVLANDNPVTITFGNAERGVKETTLTIPLPASDE